MTPSFLLLALVTLAGAIAAMTLRQLVHCALALVVAFAGLAGLYLQLNAQFVGLAQVLVYVGAVAILIVFAILLTRGAGVDGGVATGSWRVGAAIAALIAAGLWLAIRQTSFLDRATPPSAEAPVKTIGERLMTDYVLPLEAIGLLLTAALIGAVVIAMPERKAQP
jgi:NADH-quinone oxidoreductase subunit J